MATTSHLQVFRERSGDHMGPPPVAVDAGSSCAEAVSAMSAARVSAAVVTGRSGRIVGILTEQDVARRIAYRQVPDAPVADVMSAPVHTVRDDDFLYHAIARMRRLGLRHMPVTDAAGRAVGIIRLDAALGAAFGARMQQIESLTQEGSVDGLRRVKEAQVALAEELFADDVAAPEIQSVITHINNDLYRRVVDIGLSAMAAAGRGAPPVDFTVIVMGSGGRGESFLYPDQDNGFILDDYPDDAHSLIDAFFIELAERMTRDLDAVGFPLCRGYVMATNPVWRKTVSQWQRQVTLWCRRRSTVALRLSDVFFDFRPVWGAADLAVQLRRHVTRVVARNPLFLSELYVDHADSGVALGWFGRLVTERKDPVHRGSVNLKHAGTLPLVSAVRMLALREAIPAVGTLDRIGALRERGTISRDEADGAVAAFRHITGLLLRQQVADYKAGKKVGNFVPADSLRAREREMLVDALRAIERIRGRVRSEFTGDVF